MEGEIVEKKEKMIDLEESESFFEYGGRGSIYSLNRLVGGEARVKQSDWVGRGCDKG